jgi:transcription antitermination factor NusG
MINFAQHSDALTSLHVPEVTDQARWYAVQTRPRFEKKVHSTLLNIGLDVFLPLSKQIRRWSDRRALVEVPLFPGYLFARIVPRSANRLLVLRASGVISFVGTHGQGIPIPDSQIENLQILAASNVATCEYPFLKLGQRVRIRGGCLEGIEGVLLARDGDSKIVISVDAIQRSLAISMNGYDIEPL